MDFNIALLVSAHVAFFIMLGSFAVYSRRVYSVRDRVSSSTFRALVFFGLTSFFLGLIILVAAYTDSLTAQRYWILFFMMALINSLVHIATEQKRIHYVSYAITIILIIAQIIVTTLIPSEASPILVTFLAVTMVLVIIGSIWTFSSSPGPFAGGLLIFETTFLIFWYLATSGILYTNVQSFLFVFLPVVMATALLGSLLRPPRTIITLFIGVYSLVVTSGLAFASILSNEYTITIYVLVANIPVFASILSIDFFAEQMSTTHATVPTYITVTLVTISLTIIFTCVDWAFAIQEMITLEPLSWFEVILGVIAASAFIMSGVATLTQKGHRYIRRLLLANIAVFSLLGNDFIRNGRWDFDLLGIIIFAEVSVGLLAYGRTALRLRRLGAKKAARNFVAFNIASILLGLVILISFYLPLVVIVSIMILGAGALVLSSPRRFRYSRSSQNR
ncbi:MAG: hypothetical protein ACTSYL_12810 [Candidatus Thorarchaeota archaeon]